MGKDTRKAAGGKRIVVTARDRVVVGLDVHKRDVHAAVRINGVEEGTHVLPADPAAAVAWLEPYRPGLRHVVYEAGPTGYGLARHLRAAGMATDVVAPSKTPQTPGDEAKSDRLDCRTLARLDEAHLLRPVAVPTPSEEADRQVIRLRDQAVQTRRRLRQRIKGFLLMHGLKEPPGLASWSAAAVRALEGLTLDSARLRFCLDVLLEELAEARRRVTRIEEAMEAMARTPAYAAVVQAVRVPRCVGVVTALAFVVELYQPERFDDPRQVSAMLGLAPKVRQSGGRRREGPLLKAGRGRLRALLVEAAWMWIRFDPGARETFERLARNTGSRQKAIVGLARRLGIDLWRRLRKARAAPRAA